MSARREGGLLEEARTYDIIGAFHDVRGKTTKFQA
jgi:hypothetical protein